MERKGVLPVPHDVQKGELATGSRKCHHIIEEGKHAATERQRAPQRTFLANDEGDMERAIAQREEDWVAFESFLEVRNIQGLLLVSQNKLSKGKCDVSLDELNSQGPSVGYG